MGGAERVLEAMAAHLPEADIYCLWDDAPGRFEGHAVYESWLARTVLRRRRAASVPVLPAVWRTLRAKRKYEKIVASSHLFAHHVRFSNLPDIPKFAYVHTPARYIWSPEFDPRGDNPIARLASKALRPLDRKRARETLSFAANSQFIRDRISQFWGLEADVIYPPVDVDTLLAVDDWRDQLNAHDSDILEGLPDVFLLGASRFVEYKRLDEVIAAGESVGLPVVLAGSGPDASRLSALAEASRVPVTFIARPSDPLLYALFQESYAYLFPGVEDFGIMPVEAMACGAPVIVNEVGGAAESVIACAGGATLAEFTADSWRAAIYRVAEVDRKALRNRTRKFSRGRFLGDFEKWLSAS